MYLSRVLLTDPMAAANPYEIHRRLWKAFPSRPEASRDFLFRVERSGPPALQILLQSQQRPDEPASGVLRLQALKRFEPRLRAGQVLRFALDANPVKRLLKERCRVPLIREDEQRQWLERQLAPVADLLEFDSASQWQLHFRKNRRPGKILVAGFQGRLRVQDGEALAEAMQRGFGPAKCFGCGLLTLARA